MIKGLYIESSDGSVRRTEDIQEWGAAMERSRTHQSIITLKDEAVRVSTAFLGIDHNFCDQGEPLLYETMIFGGHLSDTCQRYHTRADAMEGHEKMVQKVIAAHSLPEKS